MASRVEQDSAARDIDGLSRPRIQHAPPPDELPFQLQLQAIPPVLAAFSADHIALGLRFSPIQGGFHWSLFLTLQRLSTLSGRFRQGDSHASTCRVLTVLRGCQALSAPP